MLNMGKKKTRMFFTIETELYEKLKNHINQNLLDQSKLLEKLIEDYLKKIQNK
jgi:hypothetical protein